MSERQSGFDRHGRARPAGLPRRGFRRRELVLDDGGRLVLRNDGAIERFGPDGGPDGVWVMNADGWAALAFRFGIRTQDPTAQPDGRVIDDTMPS